MALTQAGEGIVGHSEIVLILFLDAVLMPVLRTRELPDDSALVYIY